MPRPSSKKDKLISLSGVNQLLQDCPPGVRFHDIPVAPDGRPDNRELFRHFFVRQIKLVRLIVQLRFPFANYVRNEIAVAVADRECRQLGAAHDPGGHEALHEKARSAHFSRALETRHDRLGVHSPEQKNRDRVRTQKLRHIHGAAMKAADLFDEIEAAAAERHQHPAIYQNTEDKLVMWIINSLSCFALMEMYRLSEREECVPYGDKESLASRTRKIELYREMRLAARECSAWRNFIVQANMPLAYRHVEMQPTPGDSGSRLSHAADGLLQAVDRYNALLPAPFEGFAPDWIRQAIKRGFQQQGSLIVLPINVQKNAQKVREFMCRCHDMAGVEPENITRRMMIAGFNYTNNGKQERMEGIKDAADGRDISPDALEKALASPRICSIDAPINDHGGGEGGDTYPQMPSGEPDAVESKIEQERSEALNMLIRENTSAAERVVLSFITKWGDPASAASEFVTDMLNQSEKMTRVRAENRSRLPREHHIARIISHESFQPAVPSEPSAKASSE